MKDPEQKLEARKKKLKGWLKDPYKVTLIIIILLAIITRLYYFSLTMNQPLWWDEADYLAYAKNVAGLNSDWMITEQHNSIFPYIVAAFFKIGFSEPLIKFILEIIPSIALVPLTYLIAKSMYKDERIALIVAFLMTTFWAIIFNSMRFHLGVPGLLTGFLAIYIFWEGYEKKQQLFGKIDAKWAIPITVVLTIITYAIRRGYFLFGLFFFMYMLATKDIKSLIKDKYNWIGAAVAIILILLAEGFIFTADIGGVAESYTNAANAITLRALDVFPSYFTNLGNPSLSVLLYLFWIGFALLTFSIILALGHIKKIQKGNHRPDLFNVIMIIVTLGFFMTVLRLEHVFGEPRWYFPLLLGSFICIARAATKLTDFLKTIDKRLAATVLILLIGFGGYYEFQHGDSITAGRAGSFEGTRQAGLFIREISSPDDIVISQPVPQTIYYAERSVVQPETIANVSGANYELEDFLVGLKRTPEARYLLISFSEPGYPSWMRSQVGHNGQVVGWEIPFMETQINFATGQQDIKQEKSFGDITIKLLDVKSDVFVYEIVR